MSNKNPFEIRSDLLALAKDYMDRQQDIANEFARNAYDAAIQSGKVTADAWQSFAPKMYSMEDLLKQANAMYSFVSSKESK